MGTGSEACGSRDPRIGSDPESHHSIGQGTVGRCRNGRCMVERRRSQVVSIIDNANGTHQS